MEEVWCVVGVLRSRPLSFPTGVVRVLLRCLSSHRISSISPYNAAFQAARGLYCCCYIVAQYFSHPVLLCSIMPSFDFYRTSIIGSALPQLPNFDRSCHMRNCTTTYCELYIESKQRSYATTNIIYDLLLLIVSDITINYY